MGKIRKEKQKEEEKQKKRERERIRKAKIKEDPERYAAHKERDRLRYHKKKAEKKILPISELPPREQRIKRKQNRENFKRFYYKRKKILQTLNFIKLPADSPSGIEHGQNDNSTLRDPLASPTISEPYSLAASHSSSIRANTQVFESQKRKIRYNFIKTIKFKDEQIIALKKINEAYRKKLSRIHSIKESDTNTHIHTANTLSDTAIGPKSINIETRIQKFLEDDGNSRIAAGKKEFITRNKIKKNKRFLNDSMSNLHADFLKQNTDIKVSYSYFCKKKPFWVLAPNVEKRETCLCKIHANFELIITSLKRHHIISESSATGVLTAICCNRQNENCLRRICGDCSEKHLNYKEFDDSEKIFYWKWVQKRETYTKNGVQKVCSKTIKEKIAIHPKSLIQELDKLLPAFMNHCANISVQHDFIKYIRENLKENECLIHVDFSENYATKYDAEIQAFHFGGSRKQISLHTVVCYYFHDNIIKTQSWCTLSTSLRHDAASIWAHLVPVLQHIESKCPAVTSLHFLSDGPTGQYRNKKMFYVLSKFHWYFQNLQHITWNFSETGHGKGAPDGVGGCVKSTADRLVSEGKNVVEIESLCKALEERITKTLFKIIPETEILEKDNYIPNDLKSFHGTFKIHQVLWSIHCPEKIAVRSLSCKHNSCLYDAIQCPHQKHLGFIHFNTAVVDENLAPKSLNILPEEKPNCSRLKEKPIILSDIIIKSAQIANINLICPEEVISSSFLESFETSLNSPDFIETQDDEEDPNFTIDKPLDFNAEFLKSLKKYEFNASSGLDSDEEENETNYNRDSAKTVTETPQPLQLEDPLNNTVSLSKCLPVKESWVLVRYIYQKSFKHYIGQVMDSNITQSKVKFLRRFKMTQFRFIWPQIDDIDWVNNDNIILLLKDPVVDRRGQLTFNNIEKDFIKHLY